MANLFWKQKGKPTLNLISTPFSTEEEFEKLIFETKEILEDIFLLKRQIRGGKKAGIPDIIGIDKDGNVCIIEMKNKPIDASVIPQVLSYAFWAQSNPDSIKNLWLEAPEQPEDLEINWDNYNVRILIIGPSFHPSTLELVNTITYQVDLIEIKRWVEKSNQFLLVNKLESDQPKQVRTIKGIEIYDRSFYERYYNKESVKAFMKFVDDVEKIVKAKGWPLDKKFNKFYCGFKYGFFNAFSIQWIGTKSFALKFKLPKPIAQKVEPAGIKMYKYYERFNEALYKIEPNKTNAKSFLRLFEKAYEYMTGEIK